MAFIVMYLKELGFDFDKNSAQDLIDICFLVRSDNELFEHFMEWLSVSYPDSYEVLKNEEI